MNILNHTPTKMKALTSVIAVSCILLSLSGCQKQMSGGVRKTAAKITSYGTSAGKQLKFVIFTDIAGGYTSILWDWSGRLEPKEGLDVHYKGNLFGVVINGVELGMHFVIKGIIGLNWLKSIETDNELDASDVDFHVADLL